MPIQLNALSATFLVVASMLGTGILTTTGIIMSLVKSPEAVIVLWAVGGVLAGFGAYCYGEIVKALPRNGGEAVILREFFSPALGEVAGWTSFVVGFAASNAATSIALSAYLATAAPNLPVAPTVVACTVLVLVTALHSVFGPTGLRIQTGLAAVKFSLLAALALYGLFLASPGAPIVSAAAVKATAAAAGSASPGADWGVAMMLVMFAYSGWNAAIYAAGETHNPGHTVRRAMIVGTGITLLLYVALNLALLRNLTPAEIEGVIPVVSVLVKALFGSQASAWFSGLVAVALLSSLGASAFLGPRVLATMLAWFRGGAVTQNSPAVVSPRLIWLQGAISVLMVVTGTFEQILTVMGFLLGLFPILCVFALYRAVVVSGGGAPKAARYVFGPLFILAMSLILVLGAVQRPREVFTALALVAFFFVLRRGVRRYI
jgi:basic amino acid/polyamine antiporter, APA family